MDVKLNYVEIAAKTRGNIDETSRSRSGELELDEVLNAPEHLKEVLAKFVKMDNVSQLCVGRAVTIQ